MLALLLQMAGVGPALENIDKAWYWLLPLALAALAFDLLLNLAAFVRHVLRRVLLAHDDDEFMPPSSKKKERKPLTQEEINRLKNWITKGAKWDEKITLKHRERSATEEDYSKADPNLASIAVGEVLHKHAPHLLGG